MCTCPPVVTVGSHANSVAMEIPEHMQAYRETRQRAGLSGTVGVDRCIVSHIKHLWSLGIHTTGSCCGHNGQAPAFVGVDEADIPRMKELGYAVLLNPLRPGAEDTFEINTCDGCRRNPDGTARWSNNVAFCFPFYVDGEEIVFNYRCGTCGRSWEERRLFAAVMADLEKDAQRRWEDSLWPLMKLPRL